MAQTLDPPLFTGLVKYDTDTGRVTSWTEGPGVFYSEAPSHRVRAPATRTMATWCRSFVWNGNEGRSELQVFDARDVARGPLARVLLRQRVPLGFHAAWIPTD